jgi:hypothetical protein
VNRQSGSFDYLLEKVVQDEELKASVDLIDYQVFDTWLASQVSAIEKLYVATDKMETSDSRFLDNVNTAKSIFYAFQAFNLAFTICRLERVTLKHTYEIYRKILLKFIDSAHRTYQSLEAVEEHNIIPQLRNIAEYAIMSWGTRDFFQVLAHIRNTKGRSIRLKKCQLAAVSRSESISIDGRDLKNFIQKLKEPLSAVYLTEQEFNMLGCEPLGILE